MARGVKISGDKCQGAAWGFLASMIIDRPGPVVSMTMFKNPLCDILRYGADNAFRVRINKAGWLEFLRGDPNSSVLPCVDVAQLMVVLDRGQSVELTTLDIRNKTGDRAKRIVRVVKADRGEEAEAEAEEECIYTIYFDRYSPLQDAQPNQPQPSKPKNRRSLAKKLWARVRTSMRSNRGAGVD